MEHDLLDSPDEPPSEPPGQTTFCRTPGDVLRVLPALRGDPRLETWADVARVYPVRIPDSYLRLIDPSDPNDPIARMCLPDRLELERVPWLSEDPLAEEHDSPVPRLVHRYPDRALILATTTCAMYCRFCTRKRLAGRGGGLITTEQVAGIAGYLAKHPEIVDVIISGGDPLTMPEGHLDYLLAVLRDTPSVQIVRIGTRVPAVWPQRIIENPGLLDVLRRYRHNLFLNVHFEHPRELTKDARRALSLLADLGIPLGNQAVLLRGVNADAETLTALFRGLVRERVRPYYLFQCDLTEGVEHLRASTQVGMRLMGDLRGQVSGLALPTYVVDAPDGGGKTPLYRDPVIRHDGEALEFRSSLGRDCVYKNPHETLLRPVRNWDGRCMIGES